MCICTHMHVYMHTHTHTHTHVYVPESKRISSSAGQERMSRSASVAVDEVFWRALVGYTVCTCAHTHRLASADIREILHCSHGSQRAHAQVHDAPRAYNMHAEDSVGRPSSRAFTTETVDPMLSRSFRRPVPCVRAQREKPSQDRSAPSFWISQHAQRSTLRRGRHRYLAANPGCLGALPRLWHFENRKLRLAANAEIHRASPPSHALGLSNVTNRLSGIPRRVSASWTRHMRRETLSPASNTAPALPRPTLPVAADAIVVGAMPGDPRALRLHEVSKVTVRLYGSKILFLPKDVIIRLIGTVRGSRTWLIRRLEDLQIAGNTRDWWRHLCYYT